MNFFELFHGLFLKNYPIKSTIFFSDAGLSFRPKPHFPTFFYPSQIEQPTVLMLRLASHTLCLDQLYSCTVIL